MECDSTNNIAIARYFFLLRVLQRNVFRTRFSAAVISVPFLFKAFTSTEATVESLWCSVKCYHIFIEQCYVLMCSVTDWRWLKQPAGCNTAAILMELTMFEVFHQTSSSSSWLLNLKLNSCPDVSSEFLWIRLIWNSEFGLFWLANSDW